jgi:hypothetical protein
MNCEQVEELGAAFALDAVEPDERLAIQAHLETCAEPHTEARETATLAIGALEVDAIPTRPELRNRLMSTIATLPQESSETAVSPAAVPRTSPVVVERGVRRRSWLERLDILRPVAFGGVAATLVLAVAAGVLWTSLQDRESVLRSVAQAVAGGGTAYAVEGEAGSGFLVDGEGGGLLVLSGVPELSGDDLYEMWLLDAEGNMQPAGTYRPEGSGGLVVIPLELDPSGHSAFAVTVEARRVDAPTSDPVIAGQIEG